VDEAGDGSVRVKLEIPALVSGFESVKCQALNLCDGTTHVDHALRGAEGQKATLLDRRSLKSEPRWSAREP
jgi:hypothetical protein